MNPETMQVRFKDIETDYDITINKEDFDPEKHKKVRAKKTPTPDQGDGSDTAGDNPEQTSDDGVSGEDESEAGDAVGDEATGDA